MSAIELIVPDLGVDGEVEVVEILVAAGDSVAIDDPVCVLESDKATMEVPAEQAGVISDIVIRLGDKISQGDLMMRMESSAGSTPVANSDEESESEIQVDSTESAPAPVEADTSNTVSTPSQDLEVMIPDLGGAEGVEVIELNIEPKTSSEVDDTILVLESDKATMEIPSPHDGEWVSVALKVGDKVSEGDLIGLIKSNLSTGGAVSSTESKSDAEAVPVQSSSDELPIADSKPSSDGQVSTATETNPNVHAGPAVRKLARELGVELSLVPGTGPNKRILKDDVKAFVKGELMKPAVAASSSTANFVAQPLPDFTQFGEIDALPMDKVQRVTAENMQSNWANIPHVTQFDEADITELEQFRKSKKDAAIAKGSKLTPIPFLLKACAYALEELPQFNVSLDMANSKIIRKKYVHIGLAVDTPHGLMVPVIRDVNKKSLWQLADEVQELAGKARDKKLMPNQMQGACFTISSLGGIGGTAFTPIVNAPEVAILGVSKSEYKPVFDGKEFIPRLILPISLSYDHRAVNGADAAKFTQCLARVLSDVREMLL